MDKTHIHVEGQVQDRQSPRGEFLYGGERFVHIDLVLTDLATGYISFSKRLPAYQKFQVKLLPV